MIRGSAGLLACVVLAGSLALVPAPASGFGTVDSGGQRREHERITRASVSCHGDAGRGNGCFEPRSIDQLAGTGKKFGAVGSPDLTETLNPAAHCDDADFLATAGYPQTRDAATANLRACVDHLRMRFGEAVAAAKGMLDDQGEIAGAEVQLGEDCVAGTANERRAKCASLEAFGRALHGAQDFYSHSNWADEADPGRPTGPDNPPGLDREAPSPLFDLRGTGMAEVPDELSTGCFVVPDAVPGAGRCRSRVTHAAVNKDTGLVDQVSGATSDPTTPRGRVGENFAKAVNGAIVETQRQWVDLRNALRDTYGTTAGSLMACALTRDDPVNDCTVRDRAGLAVVVAGVLLAAVAAAVLVIRQVKVRRPRPPRSGRT